MACAGIGPTAEQAGAAFEWPGWMRWREGAHGGRGAILELELLFAVVDCRRGEPTIALEVAELIRHNDSGPLHMHHRAVVAERLRLRADPAVRDGGAADVQEHLAVRVRRVRPQP